MNPFIPNDDPEIEEEMLKVIGVERIEDLYSDISPDLLLKNDLGIPEALSEVQVQGLIEERLGKNLSLDRSKIFLGGGAWSIHIPAVVEEIVERGEFLTAYTPYQPEVSQGILQALYEYQSLICQLTGMEAANCSLYDWGSAAAEAALMASRVNKKAKILVAGNIGPHRREVMKTYLDPVDIEISEIPIDEDTASLRIEEIEGLIDDGTAAIYLENPSFLGSIEEDVEEIGGIAHRKGALYIVGVDPLSLGILKPPGEYGADIVVGEAQCLGSPPCYGGPLLGIFAIKGDMKLMRQMPGRVIGSTRELYGDRRAYTMILQAREQHIRRERATSNICTNQALLAVATAIYLSLLGETGFKRLSESIAQRAIYAAHRLSSIGELEAPPYRASFFRDFLVQLPNGVSVERVLRRALEKGVVLGIDVKGSFPFYGNSYLTSVSEIHSKRDIDGMVELVRDIISGRGE